MPTRTEIGWSDRFGTIYVQIDSINKLSNKTFQNIVARAPSFKKGYRLVTSPGGKVWRLEFKLSKLERLDWWGDVAKYFPVPVGGMGERRVLNFPKLPGIEEYWVENGIKWGNFFRVNIKRRGGKAVDKVSLSQIRSEIATLFNMPEMIKKGYLIRDIRVYPYYAPPPAMVRNPKAPDLPPVPLVDVPDAPPPSDPGKFEPGKVPGLTYKKVVDDIEDTIGFNPWWLVAGAGALMILKGMVGK